MTEVAQEARTPVAVEVETESPVTPRVATSVSKDVAEASVGKAARRTVRTIEGEAKVAEEKAVVEISDEEKLVTLKMENNFLRITAQIAELQKQAEQIQKQYPDYIKTLASKYGVDVTKSSFHAIEGVFKKNQ